MGKSNSAVIGYWYKLILLLGLGRTIDAFLEVRGGDRTAWSGELTESATITINARDLWGGEKGEGGIEGDADVMFGEATQAPNAFLQANLSPDQPAYRGRTFFLFKGGRYGAFNWYPKPLSFKVRSILSGWDNDDPWYPDKAAVPFVDDDMEYFYGFNAAHAIYESLTQSYMQGEPVEDIDLDSFERAADTCYDEGFGLWLEYDSGKETFQQYRDRICDLIGASCSRSRTTGKWNLDLHRGASLGDEEELPVLTDDDILDFRQQPTAIDDAVNQVFVGWFDPQKKEKRITSPETRLGAVRAMGGVISETRKHPELMSERVAQLVGSRYLDNKARPLQGLELTTNRKPYDWREGTYFRLQAPRHGVPDLVCMVVEIDTGTLRSGAIHMTVIEDVFKRRSTTFVGTTPPGPVGDGTPQPASYERAFEVPYVELAGNLSAADLNFLPDDVGFIGIAASRPSIGPAVNFTLMSMAMGEEYVDRGTGEWSPTALIVESASRDTLETSFTLSDGIDLHEVALGTGALWGEEICRIDAIDVDAGTIELARGCADTTPQLHSAGERIWFYDTNVTSDRRQYLDGETVYAKVLTRGGGKQLHIDAATELEVGIGQRMFRPYAPGRLRINFDAYPTDATGELVIDWAYRSRLVQADRLIESDATNIGPEGGSDTTYEVKIYLDNVLVDTQTGIVDNQATYTPTGGGVVRVEITAWRDGLVSWQALVHEFNYTP